MNSALRSSAGVSVAVLVSRVLGVLRDTLFAALFGVSKLTDAYIVAFRIPNLLRDLFAEGALSSALVPTLADARAREGQVRAFHLGNLVLSALLVVTGLLSLLGIVFAEQIVALISGDFRGDLDKLQAATVLARIMMPILALVSVGACWMGMLNAEQRFLAPAYAPAMFNVASIATGLLLLVMGLDDWRALVVWSIGTALAGFAQAFIQLPSLRRLGYRPRFVLTGAWSDPHLRRIVRLMAPATIGLAAIQINVFVNTHFAAALGDGPQTYLSNAFRLFYLPIGVFGVALGTVTMARASADVAGGRQTALADRVREGTLGVWLLALPSAVGLLVLAEPVVGVLFERGRFLPADTQAMVPVLQAYLLGVLPYSLVKVVAPAFFTIDRPRIPLIASLAAVAANLLFNALTYRRLGAAGLALGTTAAALVNLAVLRVSFRRVVDTAAPSGGTGDLGRLLLANLGLGAAVALVWRGCASLLALAEPGLSGPSHASLRALLLFLTIGAGFAAYAALLRALGCPGAADVWSLPARILGKLRGSRASRA